MRTWVTGLSLLVCAASGCDKPTPPPRTEAPASVVPATRSAGPSFEEKLAWAERLIAKGEVGPARSAARELTEERREDPRGWIALATAHQLAEDPREAREAARAAVEFGPKEGAAWVALGAAQRALGDLGAAQEAFDKALSLSPGSRAARFNLAGIAADRGQVEAAVSALEGLLKDDPDDVETRWLLGRVYLDAGRANDAERELMQVVDKYPAHVRSQRALAALAWNAGDFARAFERAKIASRIDARDTATSNLLEASFYIMVAARLRCEHGPRPWAADAVVKQLEKMAKDEDLDGVASFVELDERFGDNAEVQAKVDKVAAGCAKAPGAP